MENPFANYPLPSSSFTALLMGNEQDDAIFLSERPPLVHPPLPGTLESLVPPSVLDGGNHFLPQKRALVDAPLQFQKRALVEVPAVQAPAAPPSMEPAFRQPWNYKGKEVKRSRQQRVSENVRSLGKLIPGERKKLSTAAMLEEAYDYIKFLEAQVMVLRSMPPVTNPGTAEVLESVVNSAAVQACLSSNKWCVGSMEQMALISSEGFHPGLI